MKSNILKFTLFLVFILCVNNLYSQKFSAKLTTVDSSGFYMIDMPLEIMKEALGMSDFMLINAEKAVVPYLIKEVGDIKLNRSFRDYKFNVSHTEKSTQVVVESGKHPIDHFYVEVSNSQVIKKASILGSSDSSHWFNVRDRVELNPESRKGTQVFLKVEFPKSDYRLYKMVVSDSTSAPLNITGVKYIVTDSVIFDNQIEKRVENINYDKPDSDTVRLSMSLPENIFINDINIYISAPRFFNREAQVYRSKKAVKNSSKRRNNRRLNPLVYTSYDLKSNDSELSTLHIGDKCDSLYIDIINGSNTPLSIDSVTYTTTKHELIAYLEKGSYYLSYGEVPSQSGYDMSFVSQIPQIMSKLEIVSIEAGAKIEAPKEDSSWSLFIEEYLILIVIIIAIIAILSISYQLIRDKHRPS